MKYNDRIPVPHYETQWQPLAQIGAFRYGKDITGAFSWQIKIEGLTMYGFQSQKEAVAKIRELKTEKITLGFFNLDFAKI